MGVKNFVKKVANRTGNRVAKLAALSSDQVRQIEDKRTAYMLEMPKADDKMAVETTWKMMAASSVEIFNSYLPQIKELYLPVKNEEEYSPSVFSPEHNIRYMNITKWVRDKKENALEKLINVYAVLADEDCNIALVFNRTQKGTKVYLAVVNTGNADNNTDTISYKERVIEAIRGNFPGAEFQTDGAGVIPCFSEERDYSVATASSIPTEKSEKFISQTIEKLLDGTIPDSKKKEYTIVLLATPILNVEERKNKLSEFYSGLKPYAEWETNYTYNEQNAVGSQATIGVNVGASAGVQNGNNYSETDSEMNSDANTENEATTNTESESDSLSTTEAVAESESNSHQEGENQSETQTVGDSHAEGTNESKADNITAGGSLSASESIQAEGGVSIFGAKVGVSSTTTVGMSADVHTGTTTTNGSNVTDTTSSSIATQIGKSIADTITKGLTTTLSDTVGKTTSTAVANTLGKAVTKTLAITKGITNGITKGVNAGANVGANFARSSTVTAIIGKNEGITQHFSNYGVKHAMDLLENQMKRYDQSKALGMWDFAAYVVSEDVDVANNVAHSYLALTLGEESYMSQSSVNVWRGNLVEKDEKGNEISNEKEVAREIVNYIRQLRHPLFALNEEWIKKDRAYSVYPTVVTATTALSGKELAYALNFPQKSVSGFPVLECAEFGRNIVTYDSIYSDSKKLELGNIFHMNHEEENSKVELNKNSLTSHTFITGSTGSGKSNTVYQLLARARKNDVKFLVVEPAKGEYKNVFGGLKDVSVYGTNPRLSKMLRINPFSFPEDIHILEHMDRLVEIFNVCWPMYAAMPAVLKDAVEMSYRKCGWDMVSSINKYGEKIYPTFKDVTDNIKTIIDSSEFDAENKGAYKGSLLTRLKSLTNGINGIVFSTNELTNEQLFEENVIVDLSRVGSSETKSLIMGMLVLKLQEYRMTSGEMNAELNHLTVLEEAHNLLKRTSTEQSSENANLLGKSVEMLSNAIAEMRTYGEGFIIADQAPGLLDMSVIRNTNTKIIMRLPDLSDRELVGRAANLNEDQILELAKLPCGVVALYQNEWVQPVLCKVKKYEKTDKPYIFEPDVEEDEKELDDVKKSILECLMDKEIFRKGNKSELQKIKQRAIKSHLETAVKVDLIEYINSKDEADFEALRMLIFDFLDAEKAIFLASPKSDLDDWVKTVVNNLSPSIKSYSSEQIDLVMALILYEKAERNPEYADLFQRFTEVYKEEGRVY